VAAAQFFFYSLLFFLLHILLSLLYIFRKNHCDQQNQARFLCWVVWCHLKLLAVSYTLTVSWHGLMKKDLDR